jgi:1,2-diacylglycerol 3-beta-galactosyltransferase
VVVHDVVPGQEAGNLDYVLRHGAAAHAGSPVALVATIASLVADANRREELAECGKRLARPEAAQQIAANLLARV